MKEKTPVPTPLPKVVTPSKSDATIEPSNPEKGLIVNGEGKLEGTPTVNDWVGGEEERNITIPVKITREKDGKKEEVILDEEIRKKALTSLENMHKLGN